MQSSGVSVERAAPAARGACLAEAMPASGLLRSCQAIVSAATSSQQPKLTPSPCRMRTCERGRVSPDCRARCGRARADVDKKARGSDAPPASPRPHRACRSHGTSLPPGQPATTPAVERIASAVTCCLPPLTMVSL